MSRHDFISAQALTPDKIRRGLPSIYLDKLIALGLDWQRVARLVGADSTLRRRRMADTHLKPGESDRLARVVRIVQRSIEVFGNREKAIAWLTRVSRHSLGGQAPVDMLDTDPGTEWVAQRLEQIAYGIAA